MSSKSTGAAAFRRRASVTAALSLGLVLGGAAVVPATVWAAEAASDVTWSTQRQILTISVRYVGANGSTTSNEVASKLSLSVKNAETGEVTALSAMAAPFSFQFQANQLKAGTYTLSVTGVPEDVVLMTTRPSGFSQVLTQVKNGETFTVNETGDPSLGMNYGATTLYLLATAAQSTQYDPKPQDITVDFNGSPAAEDGIANKDELPAGTTFAWEKAPDTSVSGDTTGTVRVTYPDGSSETVEVPVHVKLRRQMITVAVSVRDESTAVAREAAAGMALSIKGADGAVRELVASSGNYSFQFQARQLEAGDYTLSVAGVPEGYRLVAEEEHSGLSTGLTQAFDGGNVALKDTSVNAANTVYLVLARTQSSVYTPETGEITTDKGTVPNPEDGITNLPDLPDGTKVEWEKEPNVDEPGDTTGTIKVTYPDGTSETVEVPVHVSGDDEKYDPKGQPVETTVGGKPGASDGISNKDDLPTGTTYEWEKEPDTSKPGSTTGTIKVTYPDGTSETVEVTVKVTGQDEIYTPEPKPIETEVGGKPNPEDGIGNLPDLPDGTKVEWEQKPDTSKPGDTTGTIKVTYPDGTSETFEVTVSVKAPAKGETKPAVTVKKTKKTRVLPKTGDASLIATLSAAGAGALAGLAGLIKRRRDEK